jgi:hypothetical protein
MELLAQQTRAAVVVVQLKPRQQRVLLVLQVVLESFL